KIDELLKRFDAKKIFLITDQGIVKAGLLEKIQKQLNTNDYETLVYDKAVPEPPLSSIMEAYSFAEKHEKPDVIIGLGGGSSIDLAKIIALLTKYGGSPKDYFSEGSVPGPIAPLIAIPTTAGTGSEVTSVAVV